MFENLRSDINQACKLNGGGARGGHLRAILKTSFLPVVSYRFCRWAVELRVAGLRELALIPAVVLRIFSELVTGVHVSSRADIGPGLVFHHVEGIYVGERKIGRNCVVCTGVMITNGWRTIGDNVFFGAGAKVTDAATVGNNVIIAPNSLVVSEVPDNVTVVGVPARLQIPGGDYASQMIRPSLLTVR